MSYQAEIAVLSIFLKHPEEFITLPVDYFTTEVHRNIYKILEQITSEGKVIEPQIVRLYAEKQNKNIGGNDYLDTILSTPAFVDNLKDYIINLEQDYKIVKLHQLANDIKEALNSNLPPEKVEEAITERIERLKSSSIISSGEPLYSGIDDFINEIIKDAESGELPGYSTGFSSIDLITSGIRPGNLWIVAGRPGSGKSAWMTNSARLSPHNTVIFSLEMSKPEYLERELSIESGVPLLDIRVRALKQKDIKKLKEAVDRIKQRTDVILDVENDTLLSIEKAIRKYVNENDVKIVYIDYVQLLANRSMEAVHELGRISRKLKRLARSLCIGIILLSQLSRGVEAREDKRPILSDLRQSGNLEEDADLVAFLYRDEYYNQNTKHPGVMEFIIRKHRNGPVGTLYFKFDKDTTRIEESN